jgi:predicted lipoprotein with Yx(FWY)xxD motif
MKSAQGSALDRQRVVLQLVGAGLLFATGAIHLDLYLTGYRSIPTIGWLFLLQVIVAFGLGAAVLVSGGRLVSAAGALFSLSTLGGYLLSLRIGLFEFREVRTTAGVVAGIIEVGAFAVLAMLALRPVPQRGLTRPVAPGSSLMGRLEAGVPGARWAVASFSVLAALLLGIGLAVSGPAPTQGGSSEAFLKVTRIHGVVVLTNAQGYTLYWFAPDSPTRSTCFDTCAAYWPPVTGRPVAGREVTGHVGTIERSGDQTQVTYDDHPLYTYIGDSAPGQANGNDINLNGGLWYAMKVSG